MATLDVGIGFVALAVSIVLLFGSSTTNFVHFFFSTFVSLLIYVVNIGGLAVYTCVRILIIILETIFVNNSELRKRQREASSYEEWYKLAQQLDEADENRKNWATDLNDCFAKNFCWPYLAGLIDDLELAREENDVMMTVAILQLCLRKNVGGIFHPELYSQLHTGEPKQIVKDFVNAVVTTLAWLGDAAKKSSDKEVVNELLERAESAYGHTALCLSGGAMMGNYHLGVIQAYQKAGCLPKIISGSSMGSIMAAIICTRTDEEIERDVKPEILSAKLDGMALTLSQMTNNLRKTGAMYDSEEWLEMGKWFTCGDMTFAEAYEKTGRTLCISVSTVTIQSPPILLNHITAPHILIRSAAVASASIPGALKSGYLHYKNPDGKIEVLKEEYFDGSFELDIPKDALAEQLNCQFFVVVQTNPHLVPFRFYPYGSPGSPSPWWGLPRGGRILAAMEIYLKMTMKNHFQFLKQIKAEEGIMLVKGNRTLTGIISDVFTQDTTGTINKVAPVQLQDYPKAIGQPTVDDMKRYMQGGNIVGYETIAMIRTHYQIINALEECQKKLDVSGTGKLSEVGKLMRPSIVAGSALRMTLRNQSIVSRSFAFPSHEFSLGEEEEEEEEEVPKRTEDDDGDDRWEPIKYNLRGSLWQGVS
mmetsp:Transcript_29882/g.45280  ORF Transcript_29882/g.45280 Transcript_29882/m.45280 type:complete len:647 (+) Transcript_29882:126-2066(+)|eukprot:CAMPEP_0178927112 /NCGR_PEP_ID=MMETSP0786-20121207/18974_1 /TAXON_ID=186022 /ORGANISM="Thalassionema frauenfeldii, Strain CCMP 1798" /LENGTH=646 /DNA_ID=CAMNT_0020602443 /DNA_START=32 /DNA_END=1972 /DNA_ORIENTATION=-